MSQFKSIEDNEIRIIGGDSSNGEQPKKRNKKAIWGIISVVILLIVVGVLLFFIKPTSQLQNNYWTNSSGEKKSAEVSISHDFAKHYVEISDTMINDVSLHRFIPINARPKLVLGWLKNIPQQYILGAMAADYGANQEKWDVVGAFVLHGELISSSKSKSGFCAILKDTAVVGKALSTPYFEQAVEEGGDFFRQFALVENGEALSSFSTHGKSIRRALCQLNDGQLCIIDTDMAVSYEEFAKALSLYNVRNAISLMGSGASVRWATDNAGRQYLTGADEYTFPDAVNYIVWEI